LSLTIIFNNLVKFFVELCDALQPKGKSQSEHKYTGKTKINKIEKRTQTGPNKKIIIIIIIIILVITFMQGITSTYPKNHVSMV